MRTTGGGLNNYVFIPAVPLPNYRDLFLKENPDYTLDSKHMFILDSITEFHCRVVEQSIILHMGFEINDLKTLVSFTFPNISISTYKPSESSQKNHIITAYLEKGTIYNNYFSINNAERGLGLSE